jgi:hypothetical protein
VIAISAWRSSAANLIALSVAILRREGGDGVRPIQLLLVCRLRTSILIGYDSMLLPGKQMRSILEFYEIRVVPTRQSVQHRCGGHAWMNLGETEVLERHHP